MQNGLAFRELLEPGAYSWPVPEVECIETHMSWVFLAGNRVLKIKRPVTYAFADYSSLEKRREACQDEVRLNARLSSDVYLGVVPITRDQYGLHVGGEGQPIEWATLMRRLPADRMLDVLIRRDATPPSLGPDLAQCLVPFHLHAAPPCAGETGALVRAQLQVVNDNLQEVEAFRDRPLGALEVDLVTESMRRFIAEHGALFRSRIESGWNREGHGDLRCEHICLEPDGKIQIYDCVEFNRELRCADVASDLAFLLMDLRRLDAPASLATCLVEEYRRAGVDLPDELLRFYGIHRALVRAKVACLRWSEAQGADRSAVTAEAMDYLHIACQKAFITKPLIIAMTGLSGTGKSTVARGIVRALGIRHVASDAIREETSAAGEVTRDDWQQGVYSPAQTDETYRLLLQRGEEVVRRGQPILLDATFLQGEWRRRVADLATRSGVQLVMIETVCDADQVERRLREREQRGGSISDATVAIYRRQRAEQAASPPGMPPTAIAVTIDTGQLPSGTIDPVLDALRRNGLVTPF